MLRLSLFFFATVFFCTVQAQDSANAISQLKLTSQQEAWRQAHPVIRFTGDPNWLPFEAFTNAGEYTGIVSEILDNLEQRTGLRFERIPSGTWRDALAMASQGEIDVISGDLADEEIRRSHSFTQPYLERPLAIVMRSRQTEIVPDLYDVVGERIAVVAGYGYTWELAQRYPDIDFIEVDSIQDGLSGVASARLDAFVASFPAASYQINQMGLSNLRIVGSLPVVMKMGLAVRNDWPELRAILNKAISEISAAEKHEIVEHWMQQKYIERFNYGQLWMLGLAAAALSLMLLWNYSIRQQRGRLRISEERFKLAMAAASDGLWDWDITTGDVYYGPVYLAMLGYEPGELAGCKSQWEDLLHPDDKVAALAVVAHALAAASSRYEHEFRLRGKDGRYRHILSKGGVVATDSQGRALRAVGTQTDISERKQAEDSLGTLSRAVEQSPSMVMITDCRGVIEYVNPKFTEVTGYTSEEALGQTPALFKSGLTPLAFYQEMWRTIHGGHNWRGELQNRKKNGALYWESETISPLLGDDGVVRHYVALKEDITARKLAEESLQVFQRFAETSGQGFAITDLDGQITYANQTLQKMLAEVSTEAICNNKFSRYYSTEIQARLRLEIMPSLKEKGQWTGELMLRSATGQQIPTLENLFVIRNEQGKARYFGNVITDISLQKETEHALLDAREQAEQASRFKSEFLANMSHEIRTPLNAIMGMAHLAHQTELTARQQDYLNNILYSSESLLGIINDILDFSKIEAGRLQMEQTDFLLESVFDKLSNLESMQAADKNVEIVFAIDKAVPRVLVGDPLRLGQVLINLTNNAIKFTEHGQVVVAVALTAEQDDRVVLRFSVQDTGIGIEREQVKHLFDPFIQADGSTTRKYGGTGLGLTISKQLVLLMQGEIGVESEPGSGSTFYFSAEFKRGHEGLEKPTMAAQGLSGTRVLVVDDNAMARQTLVEMLEALSFDVTAVVSGAAALAELERVGSEASKQPYQLVLMDWKMPSMDGIEASRLIRQSDWLPHQPSIIMLSAYGREDIVPLATEVGVADFLAKPVNPSTLFDTIISALAPTLAVVPESRPVFATASRPSNLQGAHVLVVEDNRINQQVAQELLENVGVKVSVANNGALAVKAVRADSFDLVLMDIQMPDLDGYQATRMIRKDPRFKQLPIVAMTAHAMVGDREKCLAAGMNDHLAKPINPEGLYAMLSQWLTRSDAEPLADSSGLDDGSVLPGHLPGVDINKGLECIGGNRQLFRRLLLEFLEDHRADDQVLARALYTKDEALACRLVHTLRGVAGSIGAEGLETKAAALERALMNGLSYVESLIPFAGEFRVVMDGLMAQESLLTEPSPTANSEGLDLRQCLAELESLLVQGDAKAKACFVQCKAMLTEHVEDRARVRLLEEHIVGYDFDEALSMLQEILPALPPLFKE